jgi:uncharacterized coiled-coil protein SlyX
MPTSVDPEQLAIRLTNLEMLFTHLERQAAELNRIVVDQGRKIEQLEKQLQQVPSPPVEDAADLDQ